MQNRSKCCQKEVKSENFSLKGKSDKMSVCLRQKRRKKMSTETRRRRRRRRKAKNSFKLLEYCDTKEYRVLSRQWRVFSFFSFFLLSPSSRERKKPTIYLPKSTGCESINDAISKTKDAIDASVDCRCFILFNDAFKSLIAPQTIQFVTGSFIPWIFCKQQSQQIASLE